MPGTLPCTLPMLPVGPSVSLPGLPSGGPSGGSYLSGLPGGGSGSLPGGGSRLPTISRGESGNLPGGGSGLPVMSRGGSDSLPFLSAQQQVLQTRFQMAFSCFAGLVWNKICNEPSFRVSCNLKYRCSDSIRRCEQEWQGLQSSTPTNLLDDVSSRHLSSQHLSSQQQWEPRRL